MGTFEQRYGWVRALSKHRFVLWLLVCCAVLWPALGAAQSPSVASVGVAAEAAGGSAPGLMTQRTGFKADRSWPVTQLGQSKVQGYALQMGYLMDVEGTLSIDDVRAQADAFVAADPHQNHLLGSHGAVWLHLRVALSPERAAQVAQRGPDSDPWVLSIPVPLLDDVRLYRSSGTGSALLAEELAGDHHANADWAYPSNAPSFKLNMRPGETVDVWLRVAHPIVTQLPVNLKEEGLYLRDSHRYFWLAGLVIGSILFLTVYASFVSFFFRDKTHALFVFYLLTSLLVLFAYSGINGYLAWRTSPWWTDASVGVWQLLASMASALFVASMLQTQAHHKRTHDWLMLAAGMNVLSIPVYLWADRFSIGAPLLALTVVATYSLNALAGALAWRRKDHSGRTVFVFFSILVANVLLGAVMVVAQWHVYWYEQTFVFLYLALGMPALLLDLNLKMRHQLAAQIRMQGLRSQDALTDTLRAPFLLSRIQTALSVPQKRKRSALVLISVSNLPYMSQHFPQDVVEQTLLRSALKIKRVFHEMDSIGRVGTHRFAVLLDTADREHINKLCVELIASGLMPTKIMQHNITIIFQFSVAILGEYKGRPEQLVGELHKLCDTMSPRTQKPIRYLQADGSPAADDDEPGGRGGPNSATGVVDSRYPHPRYSPKDGAKGDESWMHFEHLGALPANAQTRQSKGSPAQHTDVSPSSRPPLHSKNSLPSAGHSSQLPSEFGRA